MTVYNIDHGLGLVREFHDAFKVERVPLTQEGLDLRISFILSEFSEYYLALSEKNKVEQLDALVDIAYFALGTIDIYELQRPKSVVVRGHDNLTYALFPVLTHRTQYAECTLYTALFYLVRTAHTLAKSLGDFKGALDEVHRSNMTKLEDGKPLIMAGKIKKGKNYSAPQLSQFLK